MMLFFIEGASNSYTIGNFQPDMPTSTEVRTLHSTPSKDTVNINRLETEKYLDKSFNKSLYGSIQSLNSSAVSEDGRLLFL